MAQIADKTKARVEDIKNIIIWGNHSLTQYPDWHHAKIIVDGKEKSVASVVGDDAWLKEKFMPRVAKRGGEIISVMKKSSAASAATAACDHVHDWLVGTKPGEIVNMGVISDGNTYDVAPGIIYSFPVTCKNGEWTIVTGLELNEFSRQKMKATEKELFEERKMALDF